MIKTNAEKIDTAMAKDLNLFNKGGKEDDIDRYAKQDKKKNQTNIKWTLASWNIQVELSNEVEKADIDILGVMEIQMK